MRINRLMVLKYAVLSFVFSLVVLFISFGSIPGSCIIGVFIGGTVYLRLLQGLIELELLGAIQLYPSSLVVFGFNLLVTLLGYQLKDVGLGEPLNQYIFAGYLLFYIPILYLLYSFSIRDIYNHGTCVSPEAIQEVTLIDEDSEI